MEHTKLWLAIAVGAGWVAVSEHARAEAFSGFTSLDRPSYQSMGGADLGLGFIDDNDQALRFELHGQYLLDGGTGLYGMLPFSRLFVDALLFDPAIAMGNLEVGGFYMVPASATMDFALRGGVALPTADSNLNGNITNPIAHSVRITDMALAIPDTTWLRLAASPTMTSGDAFFRVDVGLDVPLRTNVGADPLIRVNVGGGIDLDRVSLLAELAMLFETDGGDDLISSALTARFHGRQFEPGVGIVVPINDAVRDVLDLGLIFSMQVRLD